ncbi:MAG: hypothetical protein WBA91_10725, partial [Paracoccaceae bacterium]
LLNFSAMVSLFRWSVSFGLEATPGSTEPSDPHIWQFIVVVLFALIFSWMVRHSASSSIVAIDKVLEEISELVVLGEASKNEVISQSRQTD